MSIIKEYNNFFLPADNLETAKDFYNNKLGLDVNYYLPKRGMVVFKVGENEHTIILCKAENVKPAILFTVYDVRQAYETLKEKKVEFVSKPYEVMTGLCVEFTDPFGNKLGIMDYSNMLHL